MALARLSLRRNDAAAGLDHLRAAAPGTACSRTSRRCARRPSPRRRAGKGARRGRRGPRPRPDALHGGLREDARAGEARPRGRRVGDDPARVHARLGGERDRAGDGLRPGRPPRRRRRRAGGGRERRRERAEPPAVYSARRTSPMVHYLRGWLAQARGDAAGASALFAKGGAGTSSTPTRTASKSSSPSRRRPRPTRRTPTRATCSATSSTASPARGRPRAMEAGGRPRRQACALVAEHRVGRAAASPGRRAASEAYRKAFAIDPSDARVLLELDQTAERLRVPSAERRALLDAHRATVDARDDLTMRWIDVTLAAGGPADLEPVRQALLTRHFHSWRACTASTRRSWTSTSASAISPWRRRT